MDTLLGSFSLDVLDPDNLSHWKDERYAGAEKRGDNCIIYDWFSMTSRIDSVESFIKLLDFKYDIKWVESYGFYGYKDRLVFDGISIHYNHRQPDSNYPLLEMSGHGCRDYDTYTDGNWQRLFDFALDTENYHITRLDVAFDDRTGLLDINKIINKTQQRYYVAKSQKGEYINSFSRNVDAWSVLFGTKKSDFYIRIYDKARERGFTDDRHWIRVESVFKDERALNFLKNNLPLGEKYLGVLKNYLRFVEPDRSDSNKRRWKTSKWWDKFLSEVGRVSCYTPKDVEYNLNRIGRYVMHQAGNSIDTYIKCVGLLSFLDELKCRDTKLTIHQKRIIEEYRVKIQSEIEKEHLKNDP